MPRVRWPYAVATALYCALIFFLSAQPALPDRAPSWFRFPGSDKLAHVLLYAGLAALIRVGLVRSDAGVSARIRRLAPLGFAVLYGISDEIHQLFVPNRSFELLDLLADAAGATIVVAAMEWQRQRRTRGGTLVRERQ
jgi:hypothetical protein